jgi:hypothetical protein
MSLEYHRYRSEFIKPVAALALHEFGPAPVFDSRGRTMRHKLKDRELMLLKQTRQNRNSLYVSTRMVDHLSLIDDMVGVEVTGYISMFPLQDEAAAGYLKGRLSQYKLSSKQIPSHKAQLPDKPTIFIQAIVADSRYRHEHRLKKVMETMFLSQLATLLHSDCDRFILLAEAHKYHGRKLMKTLGFVRQKNRSPEGKEIWLFDSDNPASNSLLGLSRNHKAQQLLSDLRRVAGFLKGKKQKDQLHKFEDDLFDLIFTGVR